MALLRRRQLFSQLTFEKNGSCKKLDMWDFMNAKIYVEDTWTNRLLIYIFWFLYCIAIIIGICLLCTKHFIGFFIGKYQQYYGIEKKYF